MICKKCGATMVSEHHPYDGPIWYCPNCKNIEIKDNHHLTFSNVEIMGFKGALRGMRNPMDSWAKSDTDFTTGRIGPNDFDLCVRLIKAGTEHRKFLRQIIVSVDITAPRYWWAEFDTYKVGTAANSTSTMHKLSSKPITLDMFALDEDYNLTTWNLIIHNLEEIRLKFKETKDYKWFRQLKQMLPESFKNTRTVTMNYEVIMNMLRQRENHRLTEWREEFVNWAFTLPYMEDFYNATRKDITPTLR